LLARGGPRPTAQAVGGRAVASAQKEFRQFFPEPGWVEHDAEEIFRSQLDCARAALKKARLRPEKLSAIGITNQRETVVVWNRRTGRAVHRAIVCRTGAPPTAARCWRRKASPRRYARSRVAVWDR